jgi:hypothetical protein
MAIGVLMAGPGVTEDTYRQLTEKMFGGSTMRPEQSPEGLIIHSAGQSDQGWYIYDIWESQEHFQRFVEEKLRPAMESLGTAAGGAPPQPQFFPISTLVKGSL